MTLTKNAKGTATTRTSGPHRTRTTRRSVHRSQESGARSQVGARTRPAMITVDDALFAEARDWTVLAGAAGAGWLVAAIAFGLV
jgi:hypothetical protein